MPDEGLPLSLSKHAFYDSAAIPNQTVFRFQEGKSGDLNLLKFDDVNEDELAQAAVPR